MLSQPLRKRRQRQVRLTNETLLAYQTKTARFKTTRCIKSIALFAINRPPILKHQTFTAETHRQSISSSAATWKSWESLSISQTLEVTTSSLVYCLSQVYCRPAIISSVPRNASDTTQTPCPRHHTRAMRLSILQVDEDAKLHSVVPENVNQYYILLSDMSFQEREDFLQLLVKARVGRNSDKNRKNAMCSGAQRREAQRADLEHSNRSEHMILSSPRHFERLSTRRCLLSFGSLKREN